MLTATYILNRVRSKSISTTPYELWNGRKPRLDYLRPWGFAGYVHNPTHKHGKLGPRAVKRIIRYLRGTTDLVLCYQGGDLKLRGYSDTDWGGDLDESKSTS